LEDVILKLDAPFLDGTTCTAPEETV
jgi:hypothetical protein